MRRLLLVAGSGRSGTSLMTSTLRELDFHVPQPEVEPDETNPKGFGESRWVVDFHAGLLKRAGVRIADADPRARDRVAPLCADPEIRAELQEWLEAEFARGERVLIKDPRLLWFLPIWEAAGQGAGATVGVVTLLRHPAEVVRSKLSWYSHVPDTEASSLAGWVNTMLEAEDRTLHLPRRHILFTDLQQDWVAQVNALADTFDIPELAAAVDANRPAVEALHDHSLHRSKAEWTDLTVPDELLRIAGRLWDELVRIDDGGAESRDVLTESREQYDAFYAQIESIAQSSLTTQIRPVQAEVRRLTRRVAKLEERLATCRADLKKARARLRETRSALRESTAETSGRGPLRSLAGRWRPRQ